MRALVALSIEEISLVMVVTSRLPIVSAEAAVMKKRMFLMATILTEKCYDFGRKFRRRIVVIWIV